MTKPMETPNELARRIIEHMQKTGPAFANLDMEILDAAPGFVRARMKVRPEFLNSHGICHGGYIFTFADSVFGFACNSHNQASVGANCNISFLRRVEEGEVLTAEATEIHTEGRSSLYDIAISNEDGHKVALMRARARAVGGENVPD